ncbi:hypothetical protein D1R32_gp375 [Tunisvirus fontaine2]|uniref:Uncharacterized protein n=1 Tax=Tunisvirus fontaine2 TaxID=1421067 RepID=V9SH55_9VIRU|nr:hypothetical protein D1R32_gp375 [Tunisvirus fontaine2]AHC55092.1 hypothetical protein TNS_ORF374 [Tunisvirus fontaine2]
MSNSTSAFVVEAPASLSQVGNVPKSRDDAKSLRKSVDRRLDELFRELGIHKDVQVPIFERKKHCKFENIAVYHPESDDEDESSSEDESPQKSRVVTRRDNLDWTRCPFDYVGPLGQDFDGDEANQICGIFPNIRPCYEGTFSGRIKSIERSDIGRIPEPKYHIESLILSDFSKERNRTKPIDIPHPEDWKKQLLAKQKVEEQKKRALREERKRRK